MNVPIAPPPAPVAPTAPAAKPVTPTPAAPPAEEPRFEVTVGGKPTKLTRREIEKYAGKGAFADQTVSQVKEALKAIKQREAELAERESLWDDDERLQAELEKRGKLEKLALGKLQKKMAEQEMTPDQRKAAEKEAENAELRAKVRAAEDEKAEQRLNENAKRMQARVESVLDEAWERAGFERGADSFYAVQEVLKEWRDLGILPKRPEDWSPSFADRIVETARENMEGTDKRREAAVLKGLKGEALEKRLGKSVVDELLRYKVEQLRGGGAKKPGSAPAQAPATPSQYTTPQDALKKMRGG